MRGARAEGMGECAQASFSDITAGVPFTVLRRFSPYPQKLLRLRLLRRRHLFRHFVTPSPQGEGSVAHRIFADISRDKLSKMSALADISHKCDKKSSRTFQRNFFQRDPKAIVIAARVPLFQCRFATLKFTPPALCGRKGNFALCGARVGALPQHPASLREGLTQALLFGAHQNFMSTQHGNTRHRCDRWFHLLFFLPASYNFIARSATRNFGNNKHIVFD